MPDFYFRLRIIEDNRTHEILLLEDISNWTWIRDVDEELKQKEKNEEQKNAWYFNLV